MHSSPAGFFAIEGDALPLLRSLQRRVVGPSRGEFGMSPAEARVLLMRTCEEAGSGTIKGAVASLVATLESKPGSWTVVEAVPGLLPVSRLTVGRTEYWDHPPRWLGPKAIVAGDMKRHGLRPPLAVTRVTSRGSTTARVLARQRFAESGAVLDLADPPENTGSEATWLAPENRAGSFAYMRAGWILHPKFVKSGKLVPPLRQLARVASRDEDSRSDWERRLLAATRWYSRAHRSEWPADRLASVMVVHECLFVPSGKKRGIGQAIAKRFTERFVLNEMSPKQQREWLCDLYERRNDAVHRGREFERDLEVDRLLEVTRRIIIDFAEHLIPAHRPDRRTCDTFEGAMACSAALAKERAAA